jgi:hypothetical protein
VAFSTWPRGWVGARRSSQPPINRSRVFDSVSVMGAGMGIQPPRRQDRQGGEKGHGWTCPERYGWAQRIWCLHAPDSQSSWRPWRLGGSSLAWAIADKPFSSIRFGQRHGCRHGNSTAKTPRGEKGHGWTCPERHGWAQRIWCLRAPDSQTSWRPWRLGGSFRVRMGGRLRMRQHFRMTSSYRRSRVAIAIDARFLSCFFPLPALFHIHKRPDTK